VAGMVLVAVAAIGGVVLLATDGDEGEENDSSGSSQAQATQLSDQILAQTVVDRRAGISVRRPSDWTDTKKNGAIVVQSHDRCLVLSLSAPADADGAGKLLNDSLAVLANAYKNVRASPAGHGQVGGIPTTAKTATFKDRRGHQIRIVVSVGKGKRYAYLTEVVLRDPSCQGDLQRAQVILSSVDYSR
jgi:hypothetical protein